jgi:hypothetical protein
VLGTANSFKTILRGDGNDCMIDYKSDSAYIYLYFGSQYYGAFVRWQVPIATGQIVAKRYIESNLGKQPAFVSVAAMNPFNQKVLLVAASKDDIMLSLDQGDTTFTNHVVFTGGTQITVMA